MVVGTDTLSVLSDTLRALEPHHEPIILGEFNLHHPLWSTTHRRVRAGPNAHGLLTIIKDFQLQLLTVPGTATHRWKDGDSTINLIFATENLESGIIHCKINGSVDCDSNHLPITLAIEWSWQSAVLTRKRLWAKTDLTTLRRTVQEQLLGICDIVELRDKDSIDRFVSTIINALNVGIEASTP